MEAQHLVSTLKLVDTLSEQALLEDMLESAKPPVPPECRHLHYLLATPFRYGSYPNGSRFRRAGMTPGVYYASEAPQTAVAEIAFYRLLFFAESPATPWPSDAAQLTGFSVPYDTPLGLDITLPPLLRDHRLWTHPTDYRSCQDLADSARAAEIQIIRYESVRDPARGSNLALLACAAFAATAPRKRQTWRMRFSAQGVQAISDFPDMRVEFSHNAFAADPRIAALTWDR